MTKEKILKLIELKVQLMEAEKKHEKDIEECQDYRYNEGYTDATTEEIDRLEKQIKEL